MYKGSDFSTFLPTLIFNYYYYYYCHLNGYKLVSHCGFLRCGVHLEACGILVPWPRIKLGPLQWKCQVLTTGGCCLISQSCPTLCNSMDCSMPAFPVHHLLEFAQTRLHWVSDAVQPSHPLSSPSPPAHNLSQNQSLFQWINSSHEVAKVLGFQV